MAGVLEEAEFGATPEEVWKVVGDFIGLVEMLDFPVAAEGEGIGMLRKVTVGADLLVERLEERDEASKRIRYSMPVSGSVPVANYVATMQLAPAGAGRCALRWTSTFEPAGASEDVAVTTVRNVYKDIIAALQRRFGA
jgi:polyketide cyclase/dehydrase/lipid transport protein